ncbi:hypothetical protein LPB41_20210 [Thalassospira sp. MA62]|nr:hypothetical protein [Thalassospira sp. MA62]
MDKTRLITVRDRVLANMERHGFAGADPFDGLESKLFRASGLTRFRACRLVWQQAIKRGPDGLRILAMIPPMTNSKTFALLSGAGGGRCLGDFKTPLMAMQNADGGWGYPFEWQARAFHGKAGQSNAIVTSFVIDGLMSSGLATDDACLKRAAEFMEGSLWRDGYFAYFAHDGAEIHNASLWAAFAVWRVNSDCPLITRAVTRVLAAQRDDGDWPYGTRGHHRFVDGMHTGFILDLLDRMRGLGMDHPGISNAILRGWAFYRRHCFDGDHLPRRLAGRDGNRDAHTIAQAMATLCRFGATDQAAMIAAWAIETLYDPGRDVFYAGLGRLGVDRRIYMRWTQAWMVWALSIVIGSLP